MERKRERIDLNSKIKGLVRDAFSEFKFDGADPDGLRFTRRLSDHLEQVLLFEKIHHLGLGKSFTIEIEYQFPRLKLAGPLLGAMGIRHNLFELFHRGWDRLAWAYSTSSDLDRVIEGCADLLRWTIPVLTKNVTELLGGSPVRLPEGLPESGPLSAKDALKVASAEAARWADDWKVQHVYAHTPLSWMAEKPTERVAMGRLLRHSHWGVKLSSERRREFCLFSVPSVGKVWWNFFPRSGRTFPPDAVLETDQWLDSTEAAARLKRGLGERLGKLELKSASRFGPDFVWEGSVAAVGPESVLQVERVGALR